MVNTLANKRNIAIIAHVDHGKTTLADKLMKECMTEESRIAPTERLLDSNDQEKERGITIMSKNTTLVWNNHKIGVVDTPGHADFGGEVERILDMVDGVLLLVDAAEGPMPQTKFVLTKALAQGHKIIVVINKVDRPDGRPLAVVDEVFDLFASLNATEDQLDFPVIYASAKNGWAVDDLSKINNADKNMTPILQAVIDFIPAPKGNLDAPFQMLVSNLDSNPYIGRILTGKVYNGRAKANMPIHAMDINGEEIEQGKLTKMFFTKGLTPVELDYVEAGDIVSIAGLEKATVSNTIAAIECKEALPALPIDPPTISMSFSVNDSPLCGQVGTKLTSRMIYDRLIKEAETNVSIKVSENENRDSYEVAGRGELQLGILIETLRREGFELSIGRPKVLFQIGDNGEKLEPIEEVVVDVDTEYSGVVISKLSLRKAEMTNIATMEGDKSRLTFLCPSRGLIGYRNEFLTDTRGTGIMNRLFHGYAAYKGTIQGRRNGVLIANKDGKTTAYSLESLEDRGILFVGPGEVVYAGQVVGQHNRDNDLEVNVTEPKKLTNMRSTSSDGTVQLAPPQPKNLEEAISYVDDDELVEVTPKEIRLRKIYLDPTERKRHQKKK